MIGLAANIIGYITMIVQLEHARYWYMHDKTSYDLFIFVFTIIAFIIITIFDKNGGKFPFKLKSKSLVARDIIDHAVKILKDK